MFLIVFTKCRIVGRAITESDDDHRETEGEELEVHDHSTDTTVPIAKWMNMLEGEMELTDFLEWRDIACDFVVYESCFEELLDLLWRGCDMRSDTDIFSGLSESASKFIVYPCEEHLVHEEDDIEREFFIF